MLKMAVSLLLRSNGSLNPVYFDLKMRSHAYLQILHQHLNCDANSHLTEPLKEWAEVADEAVQRLLRLTCRCDICI